MFESLGTFAVASTDASTSMIVRYASPELVSLVGLPWEGNVLPMFLQGNLQLQRVWQGLHEDRVSWERHVGKVSVSHVDGNVAPVKFELAAFVIPGSRSPSLEALLFIVFFRLDADSLPLRVSSTDDAFTDTPTTAFDPSECAVPQTNARQDTKLCKEQHVDFKNLVELLDLIDLPFVLFDHPATDSENWNKNVWANKRAVSDVGQHSQEAWLAHGWVQWRESSAAVRHRSVEVHEAVQVKRGVFTQM